MFLAGVLSSLRSSDSVDPQTATRTGTKTTTTRTTATDDHHDNQKTACIAGTNSYLT